MRRQVLAITKKELVSYFGSPLAIIFLGTFLAAVLFIFFSVETFFARGIADVRPLFRWMPILLIFLLAALTMRQWSEEQRAGTQELLLTMPVTPLALVFGKFLAVMSLISLALVLTLPLPLTVSIIGNLDWGPVVGGYVAALLMAAAYAGIGLFISSRTDNQIVALILTVLLGGFFYIIGTRSITDLVGGSVSDILWALGTGSRFESIQRGVIDLRDLVYYLSLAAIFLRLNVLSLDSVRWSEEQQAYRQGVILTTTLVILNLIAVNIWLYPLQGLRLDLTTQKEYSLSPTTKDLFNSLSEPLLIRAYISEKSHPLLAPLVPQIRDMLREYEIVSDGRITAEVIDPITDPEIEAEANQVYGIEPQPFQVSGRYEASVINAYFDVLVRYGDQNVVLNFQDLIQVQPSNTGSIDVQLRNLEYDLTSAIKKVLFGFQSIDAVLAELTDPVTLTFYVTPTTLPAELVAIQDIVNQVAGEIAANSNGKFVYEMVDLDDPTSSVSRQFLEESYGIEPVPVSFLSADSFYAHMILQNGEEVSLIYPPAQATEAEVRTTIESALKRTSTGFLKVVGLWHSSNTPINDPILGDVLQPLADYNLIQEQLSQDYTVRTVDLSTGQVATDIDVLVVVGARDFTDTELFAIDQYLMRGGSVVVASGSFGAAFDQFQQTLAVYPVNAGLQPLLAHYGINLGAEMVLDEQNVPFPVPRIREVGGFQVQEVQAMNYPYFLDVRPDGMDTDSPVVGNLPALTLNWASPVMVDETKNAQREVTILLRSTDGSWTVADTNIQPNFDIYPDTGFALGTNLASQPLAVAVQGEFDSYFQDKASPFESGAVTQPALEGESTVAAVNAGTIPQSPDSSRLIVIGSSAFLEDNILQISSSFTQDRYLNNLQFLQNAVDWSVEDLDLLAIRSRGTASKVLLPLTEEEQSTWEIANYAIALVALLAVYFSQRARVRNEKPLELLASNSEL